MHILKTIQKYDPMRLFYFRKEIILQEEYKK